MQKLSYPVLNSPPVNPKRRRRWWILSLIVLSLVLAFLTIELFRPRTWQDYYTRINYQPAAPVSSLIEKLDFSQGGKNIFLATAPVISEASSFNNQCARQEATVSILGCYNNQNIYIYHVSEPKLDGIMETTAAHELLHAVYARLNYFERPQIDEMLKNEYDKIKTPELEKRLDYYRRIDPNSINNELHSIFGTEMASLSKELEDYYKKYFANRAKIVAFYQKYHQQFIDLHDRANELKQKINLSLSELTIAQEAYKTHLNGLNQEINQFNQQADGGYYTNQTQFQRDRQAILAKINNIEKERQSINQKVAGYNQLIEEYNNNATQYQKLNQSIDSLSQVPTL